MKYKCFLCGIPKARKTCKKHSADHEQGHIHNFW
jgi:hypothetical protein